MKVYFIVVLFLIAISCNDPDNDFSPNKELFHKAYGFPNQQIIVNSLSLQNRLFVSSNNDLVSFDHVGNVIWNKRINVEGETIGIGLGSNLTNSTFVLFGGYHEDKNILIEMDTSGAVLSARRYYSTNNLVLNSCNANSVGNRLFTGQFFENGQYFSAAFLEDKNGFRIWSIAKEGFLVSGFNQNDKSSILFSGDGTISRISEDGVLLNTNKIFKNSELILENVVEVQNSYFLLFREWSTFSIYVVKVDSNGNFTKGLRFYDSENPDILANNSMIYLALTTQSDVNILEMDTDLRLIKEKTVANFVGGDASTLKALVNWSPSAIECVIQPFDQDPINGNKGFNVVRFLVKDWVTTCEIEQHSSFFVSTTFENIPVTETLRPLDFDIEESITEIQNVAMNISIDEICK